MNDEEASFNAMEVVYHFGSSSYRMRYGDLIPYTTYKGYKIYMAPGGIYFGYGPVKCDCCGKIQPSWQFAQSKKMLYEIIADNVKKLDD